MEHLQNALAEVALYLAALREPRNEKFILLPHNAVPVVPFQRAYGMLTRRLAKLRLPPSSIGFLFNCLASVQLESNSNNLKSNFCSFFAIISIFAIDSCGISNIFWIICEIELFRHLEF